MTGARKRIDGSAAFGSLAALGAAVACAALLIAAAAPDKADALGAFFVSPFSSVWSLGNALDSGVLLLTAAAGVTLAFRSGAFNLGGEGQVYAGGLAAALVLLKSGAPGPLALAAAAAAALAAGAALGGLSGFLKARWGVDEMISSFLAAGAVSPAIDYFVSGPLRDPAASLLATARFSDDRVLPKLWEPSVLSLSAPLALGVLVLVWAVLERSATGYRLRVSGSNPAFARYAGIDAKRYWTPAMAASGALHALAGFFAVAGTYGLCHRGFPGGLGWNAIAVALIARNRAAFLVPAALAFAWLQAGSDAAVLSSGLSFGTAAFAQAAVFLLVTARLSAGKLTFRSGLFSRLRARRADLAKRGGSE